MTSYTISALPTAPQRTDDPDVFSARADAWVASLDTFVSEANALAANLVQEADLALSQNGLGAFSGNEFQIVTVNGTGDGLTLDPLGSALGDVTSAATINRANGSVFTARATGNVTFTFTTSRTFDAFALHLTNGGDYTITWPASVDWPGGVAPTLTGQVAGSPPTDSVDVLVFVTADGGTTWRGALAIGDAK